MLSYENRSSILSGDVQFIKFPTIGATGARQNQIQHRLKRLENA